MGNQHIFPFLWMRGEPEEVIRREMEKIHEAGIGSVCLEARPHPDFAGDGWWRDVDIVLDEAQKRGMRVWILDDAHFPTGMANNGMARHPEKARRYLYSQFVDATGPIPAADVDVNLLTQKQITWMDLGKPQVKPIYEETKLLSVTLCKMSGGDTVEGTPVDVTDKVSSGRLTVDIPAGVWRVRVNFLTTAFGANPEYINYVERDSVRVLLDEVYEKHYQRYGKYFGNVIAGFFSDEPGFYNIVDYNSPNKAGKDMPLPWGRELEELLRDSYGESLYRDLPLLFSAERDGGDKAIRYAYMDAVSRLYGKNFCCQLGDWCREHGVEYIGHIVEDSGGHKRLGPGVGHYFRAMAGQDMAGIDNIGYQLMPGNDVATRHTGFTTPEPDFYHYQIVKLGASAAAIDPLKKGRLMCENFGAYGWRLGVRDMKWLADFHLGQGVNHFVPHAFSMAEYPDDDCPPHFHARGNNPQFPFFCTLMPYVGRMCDLLNGGVNVPDAAVLYEAEADWAGESADGSSVGKVLLTNQLDFMFIPCDAFADADYYGTKVEGGVLTVNGRPMRALIVPEAELLPVPVARFIADNPSLPVFYVNRKPVGLAGVMPGKPEDGLLDAALANGKCVPLSDLPRALGVDNRMETPEPDLRVYHYRKDGRDIFTFMNVSLSRTAKARYRLPEASAWGRYDAMRDVTEAFPVSGGVAKVELPPYGTLVLVSNPEDAVPAAPDAGTPVGEITPERWTLCLREVGSAADEIVPNFALEPVSRTRPDFSGTMTYSAAFRLDALPGKAVFCAEYAFECMRVWVNGTQIGDVLTPPYEIDITAALKAGDNEISVMCASTALRNANTRPGIFGPERTVAEPTGMFGRVGIRLYK